ncbi:MAG TPA: GNAT family N-acetyltransferase [Dyella sp.]|uniref:GNAT family N-acetyltransferase n=1 Tax=Dyella sp. TaxID=1869338 RepID=UPI002BDE5120|nr:GNAT family N-acetyltransferase [Dyella sp.]HTV86708.1 GNAT family N-acetyltransferase [Dyella sp.]
MYTLRPYVPADAQAWDALVERSRNGNFLHCRRYMDYHADRFADCSLVIEREGRLQAVFPANRKDDVVVSHGGLTYAGLISAHDVRAESTLAVFGQIGEHYRKCGTRRLVYKAVPHIFHAYPAEEDLYALHRLGAKLQRRDISSAVPLREAMHFADSRKRSIGKARKAGVEIRIGADLAAFHALLTEVLRKHGTAPTHSLAELQRLQARFPGRIVLHEARIGGTLLAGVLVYDFGRTVHTQYIAASGQGRELNALSLLLGELIAQVYAARVYFSFGISSEQEGRHLNGGLIMQKERFGARAVVHDFYEWEL